MKEQMLFQQMEFIRMRTLAALDATTEQLADEIPEGFKNSIRWNLGHILLSQENLLYSFVGENDRKSLPPEYGELFGFNTSPKTWESLTPPTLSELRDKLEAQPLRIKEAFTGRLDQLGEKPFVLGEHTTFTTLAEVLSFANWHEGLHQGTITSIKRVQGIENLWEKAEEKVKR
ncbi:DinB family protein [Rossellomorea aquimaris]|uniref:DinB family protein n=1 Tax=Rossellomorea TaxID=2837508 RepID=UPI001CD3F861|nr:DinB family protein [Rossellomorea aquimaris]MCA1061024.1 DinB family protein [Rossellomorea aquimaris]